MILTWHHSYTGVGLPMASSPNLWSVWLVAPFALVVVGALSFGLYDGVFDLLANAASNEKPPKPVNINDVIKTTVTVLTLIGAVLADIYAYRKQLERPTSTPTSAAQRAGRPAC